MKKATLLLLLIVLGCKKQDFDAQWTLEQAPAAFTARFETTQGTFDIAVTRDWSPKAADRLYQLVKHGYYDDAIFYRVVDGFVAQFGNTDTITMNQWRAVKVPDEPVKFGNKKGMVSFARSGPVTRDLELFVNLKDNPVLDTLDFEGVRGFPAVGRVTQGMDVVEKLYSGYGETPMSDENLYANRNGFLAKYPELDLIKKAYLVE
ncbi:peptidylprolyl isomerase [Flavobacterium caeni]|uniref:Peptidyl-prolyl cis-trans isomerase (Rotamase)-cyclophilin family n=1 Tax=Flavobacterium caeni TaxID=490189 RepID=A0A1G5CV81_9FLAO|nr:peptidylprolyl isomerase [Flavobacterium caeni]SCY06294.1 Peptidyl-prolyl cis-trans isomerase (rotamase)-cyclophilin family [Flavobacterium caeni]